MTSPDMHDEWLNRPRGLRHLGFAEWLQRDSGVVGGHPKAPDAPRPPQRPRSKAPKKSVPRGTMPKKKSPGEEGLVLAFRANGITDYEREYQFDPKRQWKFDFAWPDRHLAVEVEGGTKFGKSRHSQGDGFEDDCRKYGAATIQGWAVLRFSTRMVLSGEARDLILGLLR